MGVDWTGLVFLHSVFGGLALHIQVYTFYKLHVLRVK